ncbi:ATP-dependent zinc protease family protein [Halomonas stenophila]|uniref:ATP-dependent zinc protease family protein n=1 Tax=Halomonas stenophila TaxID=795312 RepID=UPI00161D2330|nr:ATP-dependent zinc protease [Halomonas stenophila]
MPLRPPLMLSLLGLTWLGGCALVPADRPDPPEPLTPPAFEARIDRLEETLSARCDARLEMLAQHRQQQQRLTTDVREVGSLLRNLRQDVAGLSADAAESPTVADCPAGDERLANKALLGRSEWVGFPSVGTYLEARIDSGANTSSLSATEITTFERDGEDWVRFKLGLNDEDGAVDAVRDDWIEAPVERRVRIVQANGEQSRPVIRLLMTLGSIRETVEFTLTDRIPLDYPVLLGRRFLMDIAVVDVAQEHIHERPSFPDDGPATEDGANEPDGEAEQDNGSASP